ncbi:protein of unknown function [Lentibacillus halodurans]|uniref:DUF4387 domain-containing protein n=1 Tax=Lentibacillus halodurans TaxID=237679 RepID=A0A1I0XMF2_9BACI|nr:DUF4387 domain-containing protein [Lentibacillus halodurans]SFB01480.1 protein of unknown function [Lentibacillus halodurans]
MQIGEMAKLIRSKNAGPFSMTIDILFEHESYYDRVKNSPDFNVDTIANVYKLNSADIDIYTCDPILAIKISFNRPVISGDIGDTDVFGGQQHGPIVDMEIPDRNNASY